MARTRKTRSSSGTGDRNKPGPETEKATETPVTPEDSIPAGDDTPEAPADALGIGDDTIGSGATETPGDDTTPDASADVIPEEVARSDSADDTLAGDSGDDTVTVENSNTLDAGRDLTPKGHPSDAHIGETDDTAASAEEPPAVATDSPEGDTSGTTPPASDTIPGDDTPAAADEVPAFATGSGEGGASGTTPPPRDEGPQGPDALFGGGAKRPAATPAQEVVERTVVERRGGFVPMLLGGVAAAAIGFFAAAAMPGLISSPPDPAIGEIQNRLDNQATQSDKIAGDVENLSNTVGGIDLSGLQSQLSDVSSQLSDFDKRLTSLEQRPVEESVSPDAMAAYQKAFDDLRNSVSQQQQELNAALEKERSRIASMADEARSSQSDAAAQAKLAESRAVMAELSARLRAGDPYEEQVTTLQDNDVTVPDALSAPATDGVASLSKLQDDFPALARAALRKVRAEQGNTGVGDALQSLFNARSVTPREGDGADAVLSRAEAALNMGNLDTALTELQALPASAAEVMSDWVARAKARRDALNAASALADELNQ